MSTKMKDIKKMSDKELTDFVAEKREAIRGLRFGVQNRDASASRVARADVARALTELTARLSAVQSTQAGTKAKTQ